MNRMTKCVVCGKEFEAQKTTTLCCSANCSKKRLRALKALGEHYNKIKICVVCGNEFIPKKSNAIYCSNKCRKTGWKKEKGIVPKAKKEKKD